MKVVRTIFQDIESIGSRDKSQKIVLVIDMEEQFGLSTQSIPGIALKMRQAIPGIFPEDGSEVVHSCGGQGTGINEHSFQEEIETGTDIPHLLEHVIMYLLSKRSNQCSAYCGQRASDIERGISTHYYIVVDCQSKLEAMVAADIGYKLVSSWLSGTTVTLDPQLMLEDMRRVIEPMFS